MKPNTEVQRLSFSFCIRDEPSARRPTVLAEAFYGLPQTPQENAVIMYMILRHENFLPPPSFQIRHSLNIQSQGDINSEVLRASLNKPRVNNYTAEPHYNGRRL
jgi:hypothetical protein